MRIFSKGGVFMKDMVKKMQFSLDIVNAFNKYVDSLDIYFSIEENRERNKDLFDLYNSLKDNIIELSKKYKIKEWK